MLSDRLRSLRPWGNPLPLDAPDIPQTPPSPPPAATSELITFKRARLTMGPCHWVSKKGQACDCLAGQCPDWIDPTGQRPRLDARCEECEHLMTHHGGYESCPPTPFEFSSTAPPAAIPAPTTPRPKPAEHQNFNSNIIHREHLVGQLIRRAEHTKLVLVRATPASGKTTLSRLVINQLLAQGVDAHTIHRLVLWDEAEVRGHGGWSGYLLAATGVGGEKWLQYDGWLLLDEAQTSYWDVAGLWTDMLKSMDSCSRCRIILFASHGSAGAFDVAGARNNCVFYATPMNFHPLQRVDLRPAQLTFAPDDMVPIGLLLSEAECRDIILRRFSAGHHPRPHDDFIRVFTVVSGGHAGALVSLLDALLKATPAVHNEYLRREVPVTAAAAQQLLLQDTEALFVKIGGTRMARGMPTSRDLAQPDRAALFRDMLKGIRDESTLTETHRVTLDTVRIAGWIYGVTDQQGINTTYEFASPVHEWFVGHCLDKTNPAIIPLRHVKPRDLLLEAVRCFRPDHLSAPPRGAPSVTAKIPEAQYQKELYNTLYQILGSAGRVSPEFVARLGSDGGTIDFMLPQYQWGVEVLKDSDRLVQHMARFQQGGQYHHLVQSHQIVDYLVVNFTTRRPRKQRPEYLAHLYHIMFSEDYRHVEVLSADLEVVDQFELLERGMPSVGR